ncbi:ribosomal protein S18-alanine N-acetyltransferase [Lentibacillus sp. CBA3610]|uniref:ribosomal protein S18-alanine N-acetyltransferase n=1 Tax=Lentibacillus sp. CBA3610 TaxID=2518176 RepID=UPI0015958293|nr:ribosomal protein S18-alanine N-acetyltransferase [Lentibacillus sp. CBA3610]QKY71225.1 ribosomal-protein-alanine N-acetyltransferase [Lentibacillus sp. CBA3610]
MTDVVLRPMELSDVDGVMEVEAESFTNPWPRDVILHELTDNQFAHYYVILRGEQLVGYAGMWHVIDDAQITNIAIIPGFRGQKLGESLFLYTLEQAMRMGAKRLSLEVRVSNTIAQRMYRKFGLVPGGIRKNYYTDNQEDAIVMWVNLS